MKIQMIQIIILQCLKIINKGLDNGKIEFVDDKIVQSLINFKLIPLISIYLVK